jgi:hypothetical protein
MQNLFTARPVTNLFFHMAHHREAAAAAADAAYGIQDRYGLLRAVAAQRRHHPSLSPQLVGEWVGTGEQCAVVPKTLLRDSQLNLST